MMLRMGTDDPELPRGVVYTRLAVAQDGLGHRPKAVATLRAGRAELPDDWRLALALAKTLFRCDDKAASERLCREIIEAHGTGGGPTDGECADAFYIAGWVSIHADNHTAAYGVWCEGAARLPGEPRLTTQAGGGPRL